MSALADLQRDFAAAITGEPRDANLLDIAEAGLSAARRVAIYRNHHRISVAAALAANFPTAAALIGTQAFEGAATDFVSVAPPVEPCLSAYGIGFAEFLEREPRLAALPYIGDVARLDWAWTRAERADDISVFSPADLERAVQNGLADLRVTAHPSLTLLQSRYPLLRIRDLAHGRSEAGVSLGEGGVDLMVWRQGETVTSAALASETYHCVSALAAGDPLAVAACDVPADQLAGILAQYVLTGAFAAPGL